MLDGFNELLGEHEFQEPGFFGPPFLFEHSKDELVISPCKAKYAVLSASLPDDLSGSAIQHLVHGTLDFPGNFREIPYVFPENLIELGLEPASISCLLIEELMGNFYPSTMIVDLLSSKLEIVVKGNVGYSSLGKFFCTVVRIVEPVAEQCTEVTSLNKFREWNVFHTLCLLELLHFKVQVYLLGEELVFALDLCE